jgi:hypothetical protein
MWKPRRPGSQSYTEGGVRSERRDMYDREVDVPRLLGHFRLDPAPGATPAAVRGAARRVVAHLGVLFNSVGLNLYRDGRDSVWEPRCQRTSHPGH